MQAQQGQIARLLEPGKWPQFFLINSSRDVKKDRKLDYLYVLKVLYRYDTDTKTLVQVSMGIPEPSILWRKQELEADIKRDEKREEADRKNYLAP